MAGEKAEDVIEMVEGADGAVTRDQLVRWHRAGLIPRPTVEHLGRGRGSASYYPAGTAAQVLALLDIRKHHRRLADIAWLLWWAGYQVDEGTVRVRLATQVDTWSAAVDVFANGQVPETEVASLSDARLPSRTLRWMRLRVGRTDFGPLLLRLIEGLQNGGDSFNQVDLERLRSVLAIDEGANVDSVAETLNVVSGLLHPSALRAACEASLEDLALVRDKIKQFLFVVGTFGEISLKARGRWTPKLGAFSVFLAEAAADPNGQAMILLFWQALEAAGLTGRASGILGLTDAADRSRREWAAINEVRRMLPPDERHLVRSKRLGKAQIDPREYERLRADLLRIREQRGAEIDAILAAHQVFVEPAPTSQRPPREGADERACRSARPSPQVG